MSQMNLLPDYYVKQRFRNRVDLFCVVLFTLVMGGLIFVGTVQGRKYHEMQDKYEATCRQYDQETGSMDEFMRLRGKKRMLLNDAKQVSDLAETLPRSYLIAVVCHSLPEKASLSVVNISEKITLSAVSAGSKTAQVKAAKAAKVQGKTQVTKSSAPQKEDTPPPPQLCVRIGGYAQSDADVAQMYSTLKSNPITQEVVLHHIQEGKIRDSVYREFQIDWTVRADVDVLDHLTEDIGIVESPKEKPAGREEAGSS